jgi:hypothetical protein
MSQAAIDAFLGTDAEVKGCLWAVPAVRRRFARRLCALCEPAVHFGNEIFKDGNKLVVGHQPGHFDEDPAVIEHELAAIG